MVTPACYPPSDAGRRYSRGCPPYPVHFSDRRFPLSSQDGRTTTMTEREVEDPSQPRKRIAVAVSSTETHLRNDEFGYNLDAARPYSNQARVPISPLTPLPQYSADLSGGDVISPCRPNQYPYNGKGYYSMGWSSAYPDEGVDYGLNYSYPILNQDPNHMVQSYGQYSRKSAFVDPETTPYTYSNLTHRPAVSSESPTGFSLSGIAASLPNAPSRIVPSDRLLPEVNLNRTLTNSSTYRGYELPTYHPPKPSPASSLPELGYIVLDPVPQRSTSHHESTAGYQQRSEAMVSDNLLSRVDHSNSHHGSPVGYQHSDHTEAMVTENLLARSDHSIRSPEDTATTGLSYIYSERLDGSRRDSQSSGETNTGSILSNGHVYVPDSHHHHHHHHHNAHTHIPTSHHGYVSSSSSSSHGVNGNGAGAAATSAASSGRGGGGSGSAAVAAAHLHTTNADDHRRSAGNLRGG
ncbi:hypothetical protein M426DRAFT_14941 [Hypoxylon sp. CI-4A]|nr:hypothetical protein M426DRAFT_14941 [Hypoxylon sp. CI-4A]